MNPRAWVGDRAAARRSGLTCQSQCGILPRVCSEAPENEPQATNPHSSDERARRSRSTIRGWNAISERVLLMVRFVCPTLWIVPSCPASSTVAFDAYQPTGRETRGPVECGNTEKLERAGVLKSTPALFVFSRASVLDSGASLLRLPSLLPTAEDQQPTQPQQHHGRWLGNRNDGIQRREIERIIGQVRDLQRG